MVGNELKLIPIPYLLPEVPMIVFRFPYVPFAVLSILALVGIAGCGDDSPTSPSSGTTGPDTSRLVEFRLVKDSSPTEGVSQILSGKVRLVHRKWWFSWDVERVGGGSVVDSFSFPLSTGLDSDSVSLASLRLVPDPSLNSGDFRLILRGYDELDSTLLRDTLAFHLAMPPIVVTGLKISPDTLSASHSTYGYLDGVFHGHTPRLGSKVDVLDSLGATTIGIFSSQYVNDPMLGEEIHDCWVKANPLTPTGRYTVRMTVWDVKADTIRRLLPIVVVP